jgi:hypothetical protein
MKSKIYCHRGYWESGDQQNSLAAFAKAVANGFGIETDIRDYQGSIVISHGSASNSSLSIEELPKTGTPIALNLKAEGLLGLNRKSLEALLTVKGTFVFDGSIPEMLRYRELGFSHALRMSEYEREIPWKPEFIWLDSFYSDWWIEIDLLREFSEKHFVIVVSPELHNRQYARVWDLVCEEMSRGNLNLGICTDYPNQFLDLFI